MEYRIRSNDVFLWKLEQQEELYEAHDCIVPRAARTTMATTSTMKSTVLTITSTTLLLLLFAPTNTVAFGVSCPFSSCNRVPARPSTTSRLFAAVGPIARAKKLLDPEEYNRVVEQKMKQDKLTRKQAEEEYNAFLENPSFYYALEKQEEYYKSLGYKGLRDGRIGEAEKQGRGEEVREQIEKFEREGRIKAYGVLALVIASFCYVRTIFLSDPENFLPGI